MKRFVTPLVAVAFLFGCSDQDPVVLTEDEMVAAFEERAQGFYDAMIPGFAEAIREFDAGMHGSGSGDSLDAMNPPSLVDHPRTQQMCDDMVDVGNSFDDTFTDVELGSQYSELDKTYDNMPDVSSVGKLVALEAEGMIDIPDYPLPSDYDLEERFPDLLPTYSRQEISATGELRGWTVGDVELLLQRSFGNHLSDCFFDAVGRER